MDIKQIITATVAVILICLVAIPLVDASSETVKTSMNNVAEKYMMSESTTGEITIEATETAGTFIINGESKTFTPGEYGDGFWCILTNNLFVRLYSTASWVLFDGLPVSTTNLGTTGKVEINNEGWTVTIPSGSSGAGTYTGTYDWICYPNEKGNYGLYRFSGNMYVDNDSTVFAIKESASFTNSVMTTPAVIWSGSIDGGDNTKIAWNRSGSQITDVSSSTDVYIKYAEKGEVSTKISGVTVEYGDNSTSISTVIVPIEYHVITENDSTIRTILQLVPVMLIVSLVLGIGYTIARRD